METDLAELAEVCAKRAHLTLDREVARALWQMASDYRSWAVLGGGRLADIGLPPQWLGEGG
jgi:hypothetical protein